MRNNFATNHNTDEVWNLCQNRTEKRLGNVIKSFHMVSILCCINGVTCVGFSSFLHFSQNRQTVELHRIQMIISLYKIAYSALVKMLHFFVFHRFSECDRLEKSVCRTLIAFQ